MPPKPVPPKPVPPNRDPPPDLPNVPPVEGVLVVAGTLDDGENRLPVFEGAPFEEELVGLPNSPPVEGALVIAGKLDDEENRFVAFGMLLKSTGLRAEEFEAVVGVVLLVVALETRPSGFCSLAVEASLLDGVAALRTLLPFVAVLPRFELADINSSRAVWKRLVFPTPLPE